MTLGGAERNVEKLGTYVGWLVANNLMTGQVERAGGSAGTRVRMQDLTGAGFLSTVLHGELNADQLTELGQGFTKHYFVSGQYDIDYDQIEYQGENDWIRYAQVAPKITAAFQKFKTPQKPSIIRATAKILSFPSRKK